MKIITLEKTKELLGISDTSLDTEINRYIPIIDAKVKLITNNRYNAQVIGDTTDGLKIVELASIQNTDYGYWGFDKGRGIYEYESGIQNRWTVEYLQEFLEIGSLVTGEGIAADTYIDEVYYNGYQVSIDGTDYSIPTIQLSANATATASDAEIFIGFNIGLQTTVAKGISWLIDQENTTEPDLGWTSSRIGSIGVVRGVSQAAIDGRYGMPVWFVNAFPNYMSGH